MTLLWTYAKLKLNHIEFEKTNKEEYVTFIGCVRNHVFYLIGNILHAVNANMSLVEYYYWKI